MRHGDTSTSIRIFSWLDNPVVLSGLLECFDDRVVEVIEFKALWNNLKDISVVGQ